jgi:hypothetical protein
MTIRANWGQIFRSAVVSVLRQPQTLTKQSSRFNCQGTYNGFSKSGPGKPREGSGVPGADNLFSS